MNARFALIVVGVIGVAAVLAALALLGDPPADDVSRNRGDAATARTTDGSEARDATNAERPAADAPLSPEGRPVARAPDEARDAPPDPARPAIPPEELAEKRAQIDRMTKDYLDAMTVPAGVAARAKELGVSEGALRDMYAAELLLHYRTQRPRDASLGEAVDDALTLLAVRGDEGFRSVVANATGNPSNSSRVDAMAAAVWRPGLERELIDWLEAAPSTSTVTAPIRALGGMDSPTTRDFLRRAVVRYADHASNLLAAAQVLGSFADGTAAHELAPHLRNPGWSGVRHALLESLGAMGGTGAATVLVDYLRDPRGAAEATALRALARIDADAARAEAEALLAGETENTLDDPREAEMVRAFLRE